MPRFPRRRGWRRVRALCRLPAGQLARWMRAHTRNSSSTGASTASSGRDIWRPSSSPRLAQRLAGLYQAKLRQVPRDLAGLYQCKLRQAGPSPIYPDPAPAEVQKQEIGVEHHEPTGMMRIIFNYKVIFMRQNWQAGKTAAVGIGEETER